MKIIFLDIDGVLNNAAYFKERDIDITQPGHNELSDYHLKLLSEIYHTCDARIVISSTWKDLANFSSPESIGLWNYLVDSLAKYDMEILSLTPTLNKRETNRPLEIKAWLNRTDKEDIQYVILDDDFNENDYAECGLGGHLIKTNFFCDKIEEGGLQQKHVREAITILNRKENELAKTLPGYDNKDCRTCSSI